MSNTYLEVIEEDTEITVTGGATTEVTVDPSATREVIEIITAGPQGVSNGFYIGDSAPTGPGVPTQYLWVQTNMGTGEDFTFWVEDGDA